MEIRRFYIDKKAINGSYIEISSDEYIHMTKVLRYKKGYAFIACDGSGKDYLCKIIDIDSSIVTAEITDIVENDSETNVDVTLYLGLIKHEKLTIAIQKAVEIGVKRIVLFRSAYTSETVVNFSRLKRIVIEAAKQCGRAVLPEIDEELYTFDSIIKRNTEHEPLIMAYEKENVQTLAGLVETIAPISRIGIIIGSEGGFKNEEAEAAKNEGIRSYSLGRRILRAETAAIVSIGYIIQQIDNKAL